MAGIPLLQRLQRPPPQRATNVAIHVPAPLGGLNSFDSLASMPQTDCVALYNFIPYSYGLRVRSGWRVWCKGVDEGDVDLPMWNDGSPLKEDLAGRLGGAEVGQWDGNDADGVWTLMAFYGKSAENNRLFACTGRGIWDVTHSTATPTMVYAFPVGTYIDNFGNDVRPDGAGEGIYTSFANANGDHFIAYCDGANGYLLYSESTGQWTKVTQGMLAGQIAPTGGNGTTGVPVPDPGQFRFVMSWKNRLWFCTEDSSTAYYLPVNQYAGIANPIYFGSRFRYGGYLVGLWSWTIDGGTGIDDLLVGISSGGDVVIYRGTDPAFAETFGLQGVWYIGQVPPGRNIASDFGGDLFILSRLGCVPMSKLVSGGLIRDPTLFATYKVANLFNQLMTDRGHLDGWAIKLHPSDNLMVINIPASPDKPQEQLVMSMATKGWALQTGIPMRCMESWMGSLYFGTDEGHVCINDGYTDGADLDGTGAYPIYSSLMTSYQNLGTARKKRLHMLKPYFATDGTNPGYNAEARFDYAIDAAGALPAVYPPAPSYWDTGLWDSATWGPVSNTWGSLYGTRGMGTATAFIVRCISKTQVTLIAIDAILDQGGYL